MSTDAAKKGAGRGDGPPPRRSMPLHEQDLSGFEENAPSIFPPTASAHVTVQRSPAGTQRLQQYPPIAEGEPSNSSNMTPAELATIANFKLASGWANDLAPHHDDAESEVSLPPNLPPAPVHRSQTGDRSWRWSRLQGERSQGTKSFSDRMLVHFMKGRQLEVGSGGGVHKPDGQEILKANKEQNYDEPTRVVNRSSRWVAAVLCLALAGIFASSYWFQVKLLLKYNRTWEWIVMAFIPIGTIYFSMALKMGIAAIMSPICGSIRALQQNSEFYSALPTPVKPGQPLPPILVQIPVYKEDLNDVIIPTMHSVGAAMENYRKAGGSVRLMICDDGLQLLEDSLFVERLNFYRKNKVSFVARPPAGRRGLFKKASNLNYTMYIADQVAEVRNEQGLSPGQALMEVWQRMDYKFLAGGDISIPNDALILLLDADTRVPENCLTITVGEFIATPDLPYTQHFTAPFDDQNRNYWEQMISAFTRKIYGAGIAIGASLGEYAPLVGHNAILRYSAMKIAGFHCPEENRTKYWNETTVSEDFDYFMRCAAKNMFGRYVMYTGEGFQEGISLTYIDEVIKLRKFTYGACEICFKPLYLWWKGPFSPIVTTFVLSPLPWYWKVGMLVYLGNFFAMSSALPSMVLESVMSVYSPDFFGDYAVAGFDVMLTCAVLFGGMATLHEILISWRIHALRGVSLLNLVWDNIKWLPSFVLLYGSLPFSMTTASFAYFFGMKIVWGSTAKETTDMSCFMALQATWAMFKWQYIVLTAFIGVYITAIIWYHVSLYHWWGPVWFTMLHLVTPLLLNPHVTSLAF